MENIEFIQQLDKAFDTLSKTLLDEIKCKISYLNGIEKGISLAKTVIEIEQTQNVWDEASKNLCQEKINELKYEIDILEKKRNQGEKDNG